jgi:TatD DNase family protein
MSLIDTHAHLNFQAFNEDREEVITRSLKTGLKGFEPLEAIVNVGANLDSSQKAREIAESQDRVWASVGVHPHHSQELDRGWMEKLRQLANHPRVVAIGETGLDYHPYLQGIADPQKQKEVFLAHLEMARDLNKPIIFHCRDAWEDLLPLIRQVSLPAKGVFHCFSAGVKEAKELVGLGYYLSFTGNVTYKKSDALREVVKEIPLESVLVETDCPYLPPEPFRGLRNEPLYVKMVALRIAEIKSVPFESVVETTTRNARELFRLSLD